MIEIARPEKEAAVTELGDRLSQSEAAILTDYRGLTVAKLTQLRRQLQEAGADYQVVKNTLFRRALAARGAPDLGMQLEGPTAIAFTGRDLVTPAKVLAAFAKEHKAPAVKGGLVEGRVVDAAGIGELAIMPPREVLLSMLLQCMQSPLSGLVGITQAVVRNFVMTLQAVAEVKAQA